jgi:uncharacterized membrane protein
MGKMNLIIVGLIVVLLSIAVTRNFSGFLGMLMLIVGLYLMKKGREKMTE